MTKAQLAGSIFAEIKKEHKTPAAQLQILEEVRGLIEEARDQRLKEIEKERAELLYGIEPELNEPDSPQRRRD